MIRLCAFADEASESVEGQIRALKRNGIELVELRGLDGTNISQISKEDAEGYAAMLREAGIRVWSIGSPIGKIGIGEDLTAHGELLRHVCHLARIFGTQRIRSFSFFDASEKEDEVVAALTELVRIAREEGCTLYHENEKKIFGDTRERVEILMERVKGMQFVYDPANFVEVGEDTRETLAALGERCAYFHIKDALGDTHQIVPAGEGVGNLRELIRLLPADRDVTMTLEPHLKLFQGYSEIDDTVMDCRYKFKNGDEAFDAAATAFKKLLVEMGYHKTEGGYEKR